MKRFKKTLATILSFLMCFTLFSNVAHAEEFEPIQSDNAEVIVSQSEGETWSFEEEFVYDNSDLLSDYIDYKIDSVQTPVYNASSFAGDKLTGINKIIYDKAKVMIAEVANGERESTICEISFDEVGLGKHFTAEDLGVESLGDNPCNLLYQKSGMADVDIKLIGRALRADCPYERYWMGLKTGLDDYETYYTSTEVWFEGSIKFVITVSADYMGADEFTVDINKTKAVNNAINKINEILSEAESKTDMQKIEHFKDEICRLNSYNYEAAGWSSDKYGDPWQLVYVFDDDPNTNVVCEGYSKAFMYLCNKTCFSNSSINCYVVSGVTTGNHMWNIVHWSDNKNYLVDVTNCDDNGDDLFMAEPVSGTYESGYTFTFGSGTLTYVYDADTKMIYSKNELTYKNEVYSSLTDIFVNYDAYIVSNNSTPFTVIRQGGSDDCQFRLDSAVNSSNESILGDYTPSYGSGNVFDITFPFEGKYTVQFSAKDTDNTEKTKTIAVDVKKASGVSNYTELVAAINNASTDENAPTTIQLGADIDTTGELIVPAGVFIILDLNGYVIDRGGTGSRVMTNNGNLTIIDSRPESTHSPEITYTDPTDDTRTFSVSGGVITGGAKANGDGIYVTSSGKLILEGGSIANNGKTGTNNYGGGVHVDGGNFVMNGGVICGNYAAHNGGGVSVIGGGKLEMNGGTVTCNYTTDNEGDGGGLYGSGDGSVITINGGEISFNESDQGGGLGMYAGAVAIMNGGKICNNSTTDSRWGGGGVNVYQCPSFTMTGGEISDNESAGIGGGVRLRVPFTMSGNAVIKNNIAANEGGGVYSNSEITMSENALIKENKASSNGGGVNGSTITMSDNASIYGNESGGVGGGINCGNNVTISGKASVNNNICKGGKGGAGICCNGKINISDDSSVSNNRFEVENYNGWGGAGGIYSEGTITMTGGHIDNNYSSADGGGIGLYYYAKLVISGGTITGNKAKRNSGAIQDDGDYSAHMEISGNPVIMNNTEGDGAIISNVRYGRDYYIHIVGPLTDGAQIGVTTKSSPSQSNPAKIVEGYSAYNTEDPSEFFVSDQDYVFFTDEDGNVRAVTPLQYLGFQLSKGDTVQLTQDIKAMSGDSGIRLSDNTSATLDLNGHIIDGNSIADNLFYFWGTEQNLTIIDSNPAANHTPAVTYTDPVTDEIITVKGGIITGATGAGIMAAYGSTFTIKGGTIVGNNMGISMRGSTVNIEGGSIAGNVSTIDGGGIWVYEKSVLNMSGGSITGNTSAGKGGGVFLYNNQSNNSDFHLTGGSITNNVSYGYGGAIAIGNRGYLGVNGNPVVSGNKKIETVNGEETKVNNNIVNIFYIEGEMTEGASVTLTTSAPDSYPELYAYNFLTYNEGKNPADYFITDNPDAFICLYDGGVRALAHNTITFDANGGTGTMEGLTDYCGAYTLPECTFIAPEGQRFRYWSIGNKTYNPGRSLEFFSTTEIKANWENIPTYTVTFDVNGGDALDSNTQTVYQNYPYGSMPVPTKQGYIFDGWFTAKTDGTQITSSDICSSNIKVYAHWSAALNTAYKVEHYKQGLDGEYTASPEVENLTGTTDASIQPALKNYEGFTAPEVQTVTIKADGSLVVKYYYIRNAYTLTWDYDGGTASGEYTIGVLKYETLITAPTLTREGYTFDGWDVSVPATMPANDLTIKAKWSANTNTAYKVEHYKQGLDGEYTEEPVVVNFSGTTGFNVTPATENYVGFTSPEEQTEVIKADGSLVIKYYYTRNAYTLTWDYDGGTASGEYTIGVLKYETPITAPILTKEGYTFAGWDVSIPATMPANDLTIKAKWSANTNTAYKVEHYKQGLDGEYTALPEVENLTGTTEASIQPALKNYEGFTSPAIQTETIKADGSLVVKYFYTRNTYVLSWDYDGGTASGEYTIGVLKYETPITAPTLTKEGYTFAGWDVIVPATMPAKDLTIKAKWSANINTAYKVEHYKQGLDGEYTTSPEVENLKGKTGASVKPSVKSYEGFVAPATQTVTIKADGSLVVKYYYTRNSYKITWNLDGGKASGTYSSGKVKYGASITAPDVTKEGYTFDGWDSKVLSTMPAKDLSYTAKWKKNEKTEKELVTDFVKRFYKEVLNRSDSAIEKDTEGINDWVNKLLSKEKTGAEVAKGFVNSKEFKNRNVSNEDFVKIMYVSFFGREPDEGGYKGWLDKLNAGTSREDVLAGFTNSKEFQNLCAKYGIEPGKLETNGQSQQNNQQQNNQQTNNNRQTNQKPPLKLDSTNVDKSQLDNFVERLYDKVLRRKSDEGGKTYWMDAIIEGHDANGNVYDAAIAVRKGFFESREYLNKNRNDDEFLTDLYWAFFNREPDADGYAYWQNKMKNEGYSRQRVIDEGFGHSKEFKNLLTSYGFKIME